MVGEVIVRMHLFASHYRHLKLKKSSGCCYCSKVMDPGLRTLSEVDFCCDTPELAKEWLCRLSQVASGSGTILDKDMPPKRQVLALLNPFGGQGNGEAIWQKANSSIFQKAAHLEVQLRKTDYSGHAQ